MGDGPAGDRGTMAIASGGTVSEKGKGVRVTRHTEVEAVATDDHSMGDGVLATVQKKYRVPFYTWMQYVNCKTHKHEIGFRRIWCITL